MCRSSGFAACIFVSGAYVAAGEGSPPVAEKPVRCPTAGPGERCRIEVNHRRHRVTGPKHPLLVVSCLDHGHAFTVYPPGHVPYGRVAVAPVSREGGMLPDAEGEHWQGTVFEAAADASEGIRWSSESPADDPRRRRTQGRHLSVAEELLGLATDLSDEQRAIVAEYLRVPTMLLREAALEPGSSWTERGGAIAAVLAELELTSSLPERLLAAGSCVRRWPVPWISEPGGLRSVVPEHRRTRLFGPRAPPPTNSRGDT